MAPPGMEEMTSQLQNMFSSMSGQQKKTSKVTVKTAFESLRDEEAAKMVNEDELKQRALYAAEQTGIVFLDDLSAIRFRKPDPPNSWTWTPGCARPSSATC